MWKATYYIWKDQKLKVYGGTGKSYTYLEWIYIEWNLFNIVENCLKFSYGIIQAYHFKNNNIYSVLNQ